MKNAATVFAEFRAKVVELTQETNTWISNEKIDHACSLINYEQYCVRTVNNLGVFSEASLTSTLFHHRENLAVIEAQYKWHLRITGLFTRRKKETKKISLGLSSLYVMLLDRREKESRARWTPHYSNTYTRFLASDSVEYLLSANYCPWRLGIHTHFAAAWGLLNQSDCWTT